MMIIIILLLLLVGVWWVHQTVTNNGLGSIISQTTKRHKVKVLIFSIKENDGDYAQKIVCAVQPVGHREVQWGKTDVVEARICF